jgi:4'-phosphopantetheinyl transferase
MTGATALADEAPKVWLADLEQLARVLEEVEAAVHLLAPSELAWTATSLTEARTDRRLARIALRILLADAGAPDLPGAELVTDPGGKPRLPAGNLHFNISHTRGLALFAIGNLGPLGIDLEMERDVQLGPERRNLIVAAASGMSRRLGPRFLDAWTCLEAFAKARGTGIGALLTELGITAANMRTLRESDATAAGRAIGAASGLCVAGIDLPAGLHGAIAAPGECLGAALETRRLDAGHCRMVMQRLSAAAR